MTLTSPLAVGFAVVGGTPIDAAAWATVELDAFVEQRSRGIIVATEPVEHDGQAIEMARLARETIVSELHAMTDLPPDEAIGRAFAAANGMLFDEAHTSPTRGYDRKVLVGATAVLLDGHRCTIGHVPPGQILLIEDGLAYGVPDLASWLPGYDLSEDAPPPEPLGYTSWTAPTLAETQLTDGDMVFLCSSSLAEALARDLDATGMRVQDLAGYHGRSPDRSLDIFKGLLIADRIEDGAAVVLGFPPRPGAFGVVTMGDIGWRLSDRRRRFRAQVRSLLPNQVRTFATGLPERIRDGAAPAPRIAGQANGEVAGGGSPEGDEEPSGRRRGRPRVLRRRSAATWAAPSMAKQYGVPMTHGVQVHRTVSTDRGEPTWRNRLPRVPIAGPVLAVLLIAIVAALGFSIWSVWPDREVAPVAYSEALGQADQYILLAQEASGTEDTRQALDLAQSSLASARADGAPDSELSPRQAAITERRDEIDNVLRLDNLVRVGTLPEELQGGGTHAQLTASGLFLVNGGLYQIRTDERQIVPILETGDTTEGTEVRELYGIAQDAEGLHVTDGYTVFTLRSDGTWAPVELGDISDLGRWDPGPVGAFGGSIYILETEFRNIYRFETQAKGIAEPHDWVLASVRPDLVRAVDMAIDRNILVLIDNEDSPDEVFLYERGDLKDRFVIPYANDTVPSSILIGPATQLIYVALHDGDGEGAVIVFDPVTGEGWQLRLPADFSASDADVAGPFDGLQDVAIDEDSGTLYLVNDDAVWTAQYQLPVEASAGATPSALATPAS
jgi:hypothetical protein